MAGALAPLSLSLSPSSLLCTRENARPRRGLRTVTRVHFLTRTSTSEVLWTRQARRHGVYTSFVLFCAPRFRSSNSLSLSLSHTHAHSLSLSPPNSLSFFLSIHLTLHSLFHSPLLLHDRRLSPSRGRSGQKNSQDVKIEKAVCSRNAAREPARRRRRRRYTEAELLVQGARAALRRLVRRASVIVRTREDDDGNGKGCRERERAYTERERERAEEWEEEEGRSKTDRSTK